MKLRNYLIALMTSAIILSANAQVISFSMETEMSSKNTPEGWTEVELPKDLPSFTEANTFYITSYGAVTT